MFRGSLKQEYNALAAKEYSKEVQKETQLKLNRLKPQVRPHLVDRQVGHGRGEYGE